MRVLDLARDLLVAARSVTPARAAEIIRSTPERGEFQERIDLLLNQDEAIRLLPQAVLLEVAPDMLDLLVAAERSMPEAPLRLSLLPWPICLCLFDRPITRVPVPLFSDAPCDVSAILWTTHRLDGRPGTVIHPEDGTTSPALTVTWLARPPTGDVRFLSGLGPVRMTVWEEGEPPTGEHDSAEDAYIHRLFACLWTMVQQKIAVATVAQPERAAARRWTRANPDPVPTVIRVTLRRLKSSADSGASGAPVDWTHRWLVDGHWRDQWYPSVQEHRPIWIAPYVKGPDDKPLVIKDRVYEWSR